MSKKTIRNLIIASLCLTVALGALVFLVLVIEKQGAQLIQHVSTLGSEQAQEEAYYKLQKKAEESSADRARLDSYFLKKESDTIELLTRIETIAAQVGVRFSEEDGYSLQTNIDKKTNTQWVEAGITVSGSEADVLRFIEILENLPYFSNVTKVELKTLSSTLWNADITIRAPLLTYDK